MDRISKLAYLLYQSCENQFIRDIAIRLLQGDVNLNEVKKMKQVRTYLREAETKLKEEPEVSKDMVIFVENYLLA